MEGMRFTIPFHITGTLGANASIAFVMPCAATLVEVSASGSNNGDATLKVGTTSNDDAYTTAAAIGDSNVPTVWDKGDFDGDSGHTTTECPHIANDTVMLLTLDYNGSAGTAAADVTILLTFLEG